MRISNLISLYLTGRTQLLSSIAASETSSIKLTKQELDDMEISSHEEYKKSEEGSFQFNVPTLNLKADFNTLRGQSRMAGLGVINSFFSGIGAGFGSKINFLSGVGLASLCLATSLLKRLPFLSTKFSIFSFGGNLIRGPLHILDSIFSTIGEHSSKYNFPSLLAGGISLVTLKRTLEGKENKSLDLPFDTTSGILGRTAIHHIDSMLASKASQLSSRNQDLGSFLASSLTTIGLLLPEKIKKKHIPWSNLEGFVAQGGTHFIDSLFSNIGNKFNLLLDNQKKISLAISGVMLGIPALSSLLNTINYEVPFGTLEGRLVRGLFHTPENFVFNLGTELGNSGFGIPLSLGFLGLTYLTCVSKKGGNIIKNFEISRNKIGGLVQRLPFQLIYSMLSASAVKLSKLIPAPITAALGPAISFQIGEKFKNVDCKFDDFKGLMIRNAAHLWETFLARGAYRAGRMLTNTNNEEIVSGSILSDGRWMSDDGRIVPTMAIGKQVKENSQGNLFNIALSALGGIGFGVGVFLIGKYFFNKKRASNEQALALVKEPITIKHLKQVEFVTIREKDRITSIGFGDLLGKSYPVKVIDRRKVQLV